MTTDSRLKIFFHRTRRIVAKFWLEINLQLTIVGVTGSFGKTNTVLAISQVLASKFSVNRTDLDLDTLYNLPITILKTKPWDEVLVLEYGVDHQGEMDFHLSLVKPKIAVLTGITPVHADSEHLGSLENIIKEKKKLIEAVPEDGLAVFNFDDDNVRRLGREFKGRKIFYGTKPGAEIWADKFKMAIGGTEFSLHEGKEELKIKTGLLGFMAIYSCLAAYAVGRELKVEKEKIREKLSLLTPLPGRFSLEKGPFETTLVNDAKRANPASVMAGIRSLAEFPGRKVVVLGEMGELGKFAEEMHRQIGREMARLKMDIIVGVGQLTQYTLQEATKAGKKDNEIFWANDVRQAAEILKRILEKGDLLYLKASLLRHLERVILLLKGKPVSCQVPFCHYYHPCNTCVLLTKSLK